MGCKISKDFQELERTLAYVLSTYFKYPKEIRKIIYTTNAIEGFNRQLRKVTKSKSVFPSDDSLLKMLYLATVDITKKWTGHRKDWGQIHSQFRFILRSNWQDMIIKTHVTDEPVAVHLSGRNAGGRGCAPPPIKIPLLGM